jgi:hypothetical protein
MGMMPVPLADEWMMGRPKTHHGDFVSRIYTRSMRDGDGKWWVTERNELGTGVTDCLLPRPEQCDGEIGLGGTVLLCGTLVSIARAVVVVPNE